MDAPLNFLIDFIRDFYCYRRCEVFMRAKQMMSKFSN